MTYHTSHIMPVTSQKITILPLLTSQHHDRSRIMFSMNQLPLERRIQILSALVEGNSLRSTSRMCRVSINTVTKLLIDVGRACARYQHETMRKLTCERLQVDEIWSFCGMKERHIPEERRGEPGIGDVWTFVAIDAETKLVPAWLAGRRDAVCAGVSAPPGWRRVAGCPTARATGPRRRRRSAASAGAAARRVADRPARHQGSATRETMNG